MTIQRARLGVDVLQGARDERPVSLLNGAVALIMLLMPLGMLCHALWGLALALVARDTQTWDSFWQVTHDDYLIFATVVGVPYAVIIISAMRLLERAARRYALLGDEHWAPALGVQPAPLTFAEQAEDALDFGMIYAPRANMAIVYMVFGVVLIAMGGGLAWLFIWLAPQILSDVAGYEVLIGILIALVIALAIGFVAWGIWLIWWGVRLNGGVQLTGDDAALHIRSRRGRARARIAWHEIRALTVLRAAAGSGRSTFYLDTGERVLIWVESSFDPSAVRIQHALLRRAVVARSGVPVRDVTLVYTRIPATLRDLVLRRRNARARPAANAHVQIDEAEPTETDRAIWQPIRALHRLQHRLMIAGGIVIVIAILLEPVAFVLQRLLG